MSDDNKFCQAFADDVLVVAKAAEQTWGLDPDIVSTIYTAVVEPTITNAAAAWARATEKTCVPKKLNAIQRGFTQKIVKANRTVSLNAAFRNTST
ncbi:unnamed protein product [Pieris macdunnoughi]|uniref:Uncharacterized protein n=1 Tax=Pieris macdunnoughi TaxID=345717 RepID=A0A821X3T2_9NEOP|nr:unnamed protein product [Pieris macdunnoughi]